MPTTLLGLAATGAPAAARARPRSNDELGELVADLLQCALVLVIAMMECDEPQQYFAANVRTEFQVARSLENTSRGYSP